MFRIELKRRNQNSWNAYDGNRFVNGEGAEQFALYLIARHRCSYDDYRVVEVDESPATVEAVAWTKEPWEQAKECKALILGRDGLSISQCKAVVRTTPENEANAARIVACVNACQGIANPAAVPNVMEACEAAWCVISSDTHPHTLKRVEAALALSRPDAAHALLALISAASDLLAIAENLIARYESGKPSITIAMVDNAKSVVGRVKGEE